MNKSCKMLLFTLFLEIRQNQKGTFDVILNDVQVSFFFSYFEDAEQEILPNTFVDYNWEEIKKFFISFQNDFEKRVEVLNREL